jgi:putative ABC transport system permease protein
MDSMRLDVNHAIRMFTRRPLLTLTVIATLAIGIGASTAIFSVLYATLLQPLPYPNANRLCVIWSALGKEGRAPASGPELLSLRDRNTLFEQVAGIWVQTGALTGLTRRDCLAARHHGDLRCYRQFSDSANA